MHISYEMREKYIRRRQNPLKSVKYIVIFQIAAFISMFLLQYSSPKFIRKYNYKISQTEDIISTGASDNHYIYLRYFLYSSATFSPEYPLILWDLDLNETCRADLLKHIKFIKSRLPDYNVRVHKFKYEDYPDYFNMSIAFGEYAWKPTLIYEMMNTYKSNILWIDSGSQVSGNLKKIFDDIKRDHFWSCNSEGNLKKMTFPAVLDYFKVPKKLYKVNNCAANFVGFHYDDDKARTLLFEWAKCARIRECIAPIGSNRANHRQDQAALTILVNMLDMKNKCVGKRYYLIRKHFDDYYKDEFFTTLVGTFINVTKKI